MSAEVLPSSSEQEVVGVCPEQTDEELVASLEGKLDVIRDRVRSVIERCDTAFYCWGEGGLGKSHTIFAELDKLKVSYKVSNSHITGKALVQLLEEFREETHVLEDCEQLLEDKRARGILRSALAGMKGSDGREHRVVTYSTAKEKIEFEFNGRLIIVANRPIDEVPELRAIKRRVVVEEYRATNQEVAAKMRLLARSGYVHEAHSLSPEVCLEVVGVIVECSQKLEQNLDMRLYEKSLNDRLLFDLGVQKNHWVDLVEGRIRNRTQPEPEVHGVRAQRREQDLALLRRIAHLPFPERVETWKRETGKGTAMMYRRLSELSTLSTFSIERAAG